MKTDRSSVQVNPNLDTHTHTAERERHQQQQQYSNTAKIRIIRPSTTTYPYTVIHLHLHTHHTITIESIKMVRNALYRIHLPDKPHLTMYPAMQCHVRTMTIIESLLISLTTPSLSMNVIFLSGRWKTCSSHWRRGTRTHVMSAPMTNIMTMTMHSNGMNGHSTSRSSLDREILLLLLLLLLLLERIQTTKVGHSAILFHLGFSINICSATSTSMDGWIPFHSIRFWTNQTTNSYYNCKYYNSHFLSHIYFKHITSITSINSI